MVGKYLGQHRTIWQEHSAKDFASYESYKRAGILYVFPPFITARMGQKIGRRPQTQLCGDALDLERGESASETGRTHIPPRLFKEAVHLNRMKDQIMAILNDSNPFNKKSKAEELETLLDKYVPGVEAMRTKLKKYDKTYKELTAENTELEKELNSASRESIQKKLEIQRKLSELDELRRTVDAIPNEVIRAYTAQKYVHHGRMNQEI